MGNGLTGKRMVAVGNGNTITVDASYKCPDCGVPFAFCTCGRITRTEAKAAYLSKAWRRAVEKFDPALAWTSPDVFVNSYVKTWEVPPVTITVDEFEKMSLSGLQELHASIKAQNDHALQMAEYDDYHQSMDDAAGRGGY